jgi:hypothetical protein
LRNTQKIHKILVEINTCSIKQLKNGIKRNKKTGNVLKNGKTKQKSGVTP